MMVGRRDYSHIGFLVLALAVIVVLMIQIRKNIYLIHGEKQNLPQGSRVGIIDSTYWNYIQYFSVIRPDSAWEMKSYGEIDSPPSEDITKLILNNVTPLLKLTKADEHHKIGSIEVGVINCVKNRTPKNMAIQILGETIREYEHAGERVGLLTPTTAPVHSSGQGAYFVVILPKSAAEELPVWVVTVLVRRNWTFIIVSKTTEANYSQLRTDFENMFKNFRFLMIPE